MRSRLLQLLIGTFAFVGIFGIASAQIYVADLGNKRISLFSMTGVPINRSFITNSDPASFGPADVALASTNLYVLSTKQSGIDIVGTIGKYNLDGSPVNTLLITNISGDPQNFTVSGTNIYVSCGNSNIIGKYTTDGAIINSALITNLNGGPYQMAVSGTNLFVAVFGAHKIAAYTTSGAVINSSLITNLVEINGVAVSGTNLFTAETSPHRIGLYTTSGAAINSNLVSGIASPRCIAISGTNLFVTSDASNTVAQYNFAGGTFNARLVTNVPFAYGIAVGPTFQSIKLENGAALPTWNTVVGQSYQLQFTTNLSQPHWNNFQGPTNAATITESASNYISVDRQRFYRVLYLP